MTNTNIYLYFDGNCEEAFVFYKKIFGRDFIYMGKFKDTPESEASHIKESDKLKIMHVALPIGNSILMGSDSGGGWTSDFKQGNNFAVFVSTESKEEADRIFNELSQGGEITYPIKNVFWGDYFGKLTDKFGINWIISFTDKKN